MTDDGVAGVVGTGRLEAALRAQIRTQGDLVDAQQDKQDSLHGGGAVRPEGPGAGFAEQAAGPAVLVDWAAAWPQLPAGR